MRNFSKSALFASVALLALTVSSQAGDLTVMQSLWDKYPCITFGITCSDRPVWQGEVNYNAGDIGIGGKTSFDVWYSKDAPWLSK